MVDDDLKSLEEESAALSQKIEEAKQVEPEQEPEDPERAARREALRKEIAEKKLQLANLQKAQATRGNHPDTKIIRGSPVRETSHVVPDRVEIDSRGQVFDPEAHHSDGDKPYRDSTGTFVKKEHGYTPPAGVAKFGATPEEK